MKLIGMWELSGARPGARQVVVFAAGGKLTMTTEGADGDRRATGTYSIDGNALTFTVGDGSGKVTQKATIARLTDDEMDWQWTGRLESYKRIRPSEGSDR
jgi:uncharacterized protein (TIGR03066 family)